MELVRGHVEQVRRATTREALGELLRKIRGHDDLGGDPGLLGPCGHCLLHGGGLGIAGATDQDLDRACLAGAALGGRLSTSCGAAVALLLESAAATGGERERASGGTRDHGELA